MTRGQGEPGQAGKPSHGQTGGAGGQGGTGGAGQTTGGTGGVGGTGGSSGGETGNGLRGYWTARGVIPRYQYLLVYVVIVAAGVAGFARVQQQRDQIRATALTSRQQAARTTNALCALRHDLENRVATAQQLLAAHPRGVAGIPAATIRTSIEGQQRTIRALSVLRC